METNVDKLIEEVVPELAKQEKLGFVASMRRVIDSWSDDKEELSGLRLGIGFIGSIITGVGAGLLVFLSRPNFFDALLSGLLGGVLGLVFSFISAVAVSNIFGDAEIYRKTYKLIIPSLFVTCGIIAHSWSVAFMSIAFPLGVWIIQAFGWMAKSWVASFFMSSKTIPSLEEVQRRMLDRMKEEIEKVRAKVVGEGSKLEERLAELKTKKNNAERLSLYFENRGEGFSGYAVEAYAIRDRFEAEIESLGMEQNQLLDRLNQIEASIPLEESRLRDDEAIAELRRLQGESVKAREVTQEMIRNILGSSYVKLVELNMARERLLGHSLAALQPMPIERFIAGAEASARSIVGMEGELKQLREHTGDVAD